jgi:hypothetical protein
MTEIAGSSSQSTVETLGVSPSQVAKQVWNTKLKRSRDDKVEVVVDPVLCLDLVRAYEARLNKESASKGDKSDLESELAHMILATLVGTGDQ